MTTPNAVVLLVCIGVGGCLCPRDSKTCLAGTASRQLMNNAPTSASAAEDSTALIICEIVITAPLLCGVSVSLDMKKMSTGPAPCIAFGKKRCIAVRG